jgi:hypothetical protein
MLYNFACSNYSLTWCNRNEIFLDMRASVRVLKPGIGPELLKPT